MISARNTKIKNFFVFGAVGTQDHNQSYLDSSHPSQISQDIQAFSDDQLSDVIEKRFSVITQDTIPIKANGFKAMLIKDFAQTEKVSGTQGSLYSSNLSLADHASENTQKLIKI